MLTAAGASQPCCSKECSRGMAAAAASAGGEQAAVRWLGPPGDGVATRRAYVDSGCDMVIVRRESVDARREHDGARRDSIVGRA